MTMAMAEEAIEITIGEYPSQILTLKRKLGELEKSRTSLQTQLDEINKDHVEKSTELDILSREHDFVPNEVGWLVYVATIKSKKTGQRTAHFPYDWQFDPSGMQIENTIKFAPCLKGRKHSLDSIKWMHMYRAKKKESFIRNCRQCTPQWVDENEEFSLYSGIISPWVRWQNRGSTDHVYHSDTCAILHDPEEKFDVVRVKEEDALKVGSLWKPCPRCHKRRHTTPTSQPPLSPSY
jgi:hypothetical protein